MVKRMRLPLLIAVVAIVALLLPGPAITAAPDVPRVTKITNWLNASSGMKMAYSANGDAKTGMVTFAGRLYNITTDTVLNVRYRARIPDGTQFVESWCVTPGTFQSGPPGPDGWIQWDKVKDSRSSLGSAAVCGFTVSGWDGKSVLTSGWMASWDSKAGVQSWMDPTGKLRYDTAVTLTYPFDVQPITATGAYNKASGTWTKGFWKVAGYDGSNNGQSDQVVVPSSENFISLQKRVEALEKKAGLGAGVDADSSVVVPAPATIAMPDSPED